MKEKICPKCKTANPVAANFCRHCRFEFPEESKNGTSLSPLIKEFRIRESGYTIGSTIQLEWEVENATAIKLNDTDAGGSCETEMIVEKPERIILTAENDYDITKKELQITPSPLPSIGFYRTSAESILIGQQTKLEWMVRNAHRTEVVTSDGTVVGSGEVGSISVSPTMNEKYQLKGYSKADPEIFVEQTIVVKVIEQVQIVGFMADKESIIETEKVVLSWKVENATSVEISPSVGELKKRKKVDVYPKSTTIYRLTARNELSMDEATVTIEVRQLPKIDMGSIGNISSIKLPECEVDLIPMGEELRETQIDKWMMDPSAKMESIFSWLMGFPKKVKKILNRPLRP